MTTTITTRHRISWGLAILIALSALLSFATAAKAAESRVELSPGGQPPAPVTLAIGDHLSVRVSRLPPGTIVDVRLLDDLDQQVEGVRLVADLSGITPERQLWQRTGIVGCDSCVLPNGVHQFTSHAEARLALSGRTFRIEVVASNGYKILTRPLKLVPPTSLRAYFSDAGGCLRQSFDVEEDVFVTLSGLDPAARLRIFMTHDRPSWRPDDAPFAEVRSTVSPDGQWVTGAGAGPTVIPIWEGFDSFPGWFAAILRLDTGVLRPVFASTDRLLSFGPSSGERSTEGGVVINDWGGCPPPPE